MINIKQRHAHTYEWTWVLRDTYGEVAYTLSYANAWHVPLHASIGFEHANSIQIVAI